MRKSKAIPYHFKSIRGALISISQAADIIGVSKDYFYEHMKNGSLSIPWFQIGCKRMLDAADVDDMLACRKIPAATKPVA